MTGSLQIKNNKYYAVLNLKIDGKRKQKWINMGLDEKAPKKEVNKKFRDILNAYETHPQVLSSKILFADYLYTWLNNAKFHIDEVTFQHYQDEIKTHIYPYFKQLNVSLSDVSKDVLQRYFIEKHENGRIDCNGGLSVTTLKHHRNVINQTLNFALKNELILQNPCQFVALPKKEKYEYAFYNQEELQHFLISVRSERLYPLYVVTVVYGLRKSEVLGIKWDSIDLNNKTLTIKHTRVEAKTVIAKDKTKTQSSYRSFPLSDEMLDLFVRLKNDERKNQKLFGSEYNKNDYVFKFENGVPYSPNYISKKYNKILKQYGLKHIRFHDLRHSCASLLNAQGFTLKDIQEWLGHSDIQITANIYSHLDIKRKQNISNTISHALQDNG